MNAILTKAKKLWKDEFEDINKLNEVINSKCRKATQKFI